MCRCSRNSEAGRVTFAESMFASPARGLTSARSDGDWPRSVPPRRRNRSGGANGSEAQLNAWYGASAIADVSSAESEKLAPELVSRELTRNFSQEVGLTVRWGLEI